MTIKTFTFILLLTSASFLCTGCNNDKTDTATSAVKTPTSLTLTIAKTSLNKDENTTVKVMAKYKGGVTKEVTDKVEWIVTPKEAVSVNGKMLTAQKDMPTTLQAKVADTISNTLDLNIICQKTQIFYY